MAFSVFPRMQTWFGPLTQSETTPQDGIMGSGARRNNTQAGEIAAASPVACLNEDFRDFSGLERHWHIDGSDGARTSIPTLANTSSQASASEVSQILPDTPRMTLPLSEPFRDFCGLLRGMSQDITEKMFADSIMPEKMLPRIEVESVEVIEVPYEVYFNILAIHPDSNWLPYAVRKNYPDLKTFHATLSRELHSAWLPGFPSPQNGMELADSAYHLRLNEYLSCIACTPEAMTTSAVQDFLNAGMEDPILESAHSFDECNSAHGRPCCVVCLEEAQETALDPCGHVCMCLACSAAVKECPVCRVPTEKSLRIFLAG